LNLLKRLYGDARSENTKSMLSVNTGPQEIIRDSYLIDEKLQC